MPKFVILHHKMPPDSARDDHFDLMLARDGELWTWALPILPRSGESMVVVRLDNHRCAYLDYEGPISNNRGTVSRLDHGSYEIVEEESCRIVVELTGAESPVRLILQRANEKEKSGQDDLGLTEEWSLTIE